MIKPQIKILPSAISHMPLLTVWEKSGVSQPHGFDLVVYPRDWGGRGSPPPGFIDIGSRDRGPKLLEGEYDFVSGLHHDPYYARARGDKRYTYLAQAQNDWDDRILCTEDIKEARDLEGKRVAVTSPNPCVFGNLKHSLELAGADISRIEFRTVRELGLRGLQAPLDALTRGQAAAAGMDVPFDLQGEKRGLHRLDVPSVPVIHNCTITANNEWVRANEETTIAFLKSMVDAIYFFKTEKQKTCEIIQQHLAPILGLQGPDEVEHLQRVWAELLSPKPFPHPLAVWNVYNLDVADDPRVNMIGAFEIWNTSYLKIIDDSQYIDELYGGLIDFVNPNAEREPRPEFLG